MVLNKIHDHSTVTNRTLFSDTRLFSRTRALFLAVKMKTFKEGFPMFRRKDKGIYYHTSESWDSHGKETDNAHKD